MLRKLAPILFISLTIPLIDPLSPLALAHGNHHHHEPVTGSQTQQDHWKLSLARINAAYVAQVKLVFAAKCFDCHSDQTRYPWYHQLPVVKQWLDHDIAEAKEHLDMSRDFPFQGHGSPQDDLEAIRESLEKNAMPPLSYRWMHRDSALSPGELNSVLLWVDDSLKALKEPHP